VVRRLFLLSFAAFFLTSAAWALALPTDGTYDEKHHIVRAYAVASGRLLPDGPASDGTTFGNEGFDVPKSLLPGNVNCVRSGKKPAASCQVYGGQVYGGGAQTVRVPSAAARYSPVYYLPVGLPLLVSPDRTGVVLARLVSALLSALLLALAVVVAAANIAGRRRLVVAGIALAVTPMATNLSGSVNPNGLEIAAGVLLFVALAAALEKPRRGLVLLAGIAAALLLTLRPPLGPILLVADIAAVAVLAGRARIAAFVRDQNVRRILGASVLAGAAFTLVWTLVSGGPGTAPVPARAIHGDIGKQIATDRLPFYVHQIVGQFGYGETTISRYAVDFWYLLVAAVVIPALIWGGWRLRLVLAGIVAFCFALLVALDYHFAPQSGWFAHGRYAMPTGVGLLLLAAMFTGGPARWTAVARSRWFAIGLVAATVPVQLYALARVLTRYESGIDAPLNPFTGSWHPVGGAALSLLVLAAGLGALLLAVTVTEGDVSVRPVTVSGGLGNRSVTPVAHNATLADQTSTTDATNH
jgi:hypothetical protein